MVVVLLLSSIVSNSRTIHSIYLIHENIRWIGIFICDDNTEKLAIPSTLNLPLDCMDCHLRLLDCGLIRCGRLPVPDERSGSSISMFGVIDRVSNYKALTMNYGKR